MPMTVDQLLAEAVQLPPAAQRELVLRLFIQEIVAHNPALLAQMRHLLGTTEQHGAPRPPSDTDGWSDILAAAAEYRVTTGLGDLAAHHDYYLYGTPKREEPQ